ncbi:MAG: hypothetical protein U0165_16710 [Polyangiaceae bacterium]
MSVIICFVMQAHRGRAIALATMLAVSVTAHVHTAYADPSSPTDQDKAAARGAAQQGAEAFAAKRYEEAIDLFTRAESMFHAPPHLLMIARAHVALGHLVVARENYLKITREELPKSASQGFKKAQADAQQELKDLEPKIASLSIPPPPPLSLFSFITLQDIAGVTVMMDGKPVPSALVGIRHPADPGKHTLVATSKGMSSKEVTITLGEGGSQEITLELAPVASSTPATPTTAPTTTAVTSESSAPPPPKTMRYVSYGAVGLGVVSVGVGTLFAVMSSSKRSDADAAFNKCGVGCSGAAADDVRSLDNQANSRGNVAIGAFAGGALLIGGGIAGILLTREKPASAAHAPSVTPLVGVGTIGAMGTF